MLKIAVCMPAYAETEAPFTLSALQMTKHFYEANIKDADGEPIERELEFFLVTSSMLVENRHRLVAEALNWGADYMLWCDVDHVFPADALCRLWARNVDIVGTNYARRQVPTGPTAAKVIGDDDCKNLVYTTPEKAERRELEEVDHLGFGLCLVRMSVFDRLQEQAEKEGRKSMMPLFEFAPHPSGTGMIGEDVFFFKKCRDAGIRVWCDHGVSWDVGHISKAIMTNAHCIRHQERFEQQGRDIAKRYEKRQEELDAQ